MAKVLVVGDVSSPLIRERSLIGRAAGHEIFLVGARGRPVADAKVSVLPNKLATHRLIRPLVMPILLDRAIRRVRPDIIHVHYAYQALATIPLLRFHPLVASVMGGDVLPDQGYRGYRARLVRSLLEHADCITSKSPFLDGALAAIGNYRGKIRRVTWGIDLEQFQPARDTVALRRQLRAEATAVVFFDPRLAQPLYNKSVILGAFARYLALGPPAVLIVSEFGGSTEYLTGLRARAVELGIMPHVRFVGPIDHAEMADYYSLADVTVSIPSSDGFPQTIYEASACGSFLILGDLPQYREAISHGLRARLVPVADEEALAEAFLWAVRHPEVRAEAAKRSREYAQRVADKRAEDRCVLGIYDDLLADARLRTHEPPRNGAIRVSD
jgi:glycosyltransferase involved in cell wall biosynthesis